MALIGSCDISYHFVRVPKALQSILAVLMFGCVCHPYLPVCHTHGIETELGQLFGRFALAIGD